PKRILSIKLPNVPAINNEIANIYKLSFFNFQKKYPIKPRATIVMTVKNHCCPLRTLQAAPSFLTFVKAKTLGKITWLVPNLIFAEIQNIRTWSAIIKIIIIGIYNHIVDYTFPIKNESYNL